MCSLGELILHHAFPNVIKYIPLTTWPFSSLPVLQGFGSNGYLVLPEAAKQDRGQTA